MGSMEDYNKKDKGKRQQILNAADRLYFEHGFNRVSVSEVCKKAAVSRKTFYTYFKNKEELVLAILEMVSGRFHRDFREIMASDIPLKDKMDRVIELHMKGGGMMSTAFLKDMLNSSSDVAERYARLTQESFMEGVNSLKISQKKGEIRDDINPQFLLKMVGVMLDLSKNRDFVALFTDTSDLLTSVTRLFLYGMLKDGNRCDGQSPKDIDETSVSLIN